MKNTKKGFTLIELAVILALILIILGIGMVEFKNYDRKTHRNSSLIASKAIANALQMYKLEKKKYTDNINDLVGEVNINALKKKFDETCTNPTEGLQIKCEPNCTSADAIIYILGAPKGVTKLGTTFGQAGFYATKYYVLPEDREPECYWEGYHAWQKCSQGL